MTPIIRRFVIKLLSKDQGSGITKLPNQMQAGFQESMVTEKLVRGGYDPRAIRSEEELKMIINRINASKKQSKEQKDKAMKQLADIMDMKGRKIPQGSKIMGGEAIETEAEIAARMNRENKEAIKRFKNKMDEDEFPDTRDNPLNPFDKDLDPDDFAYGGRVGLMAGGMGRRAFLKMIAGAGGLAAAAKTGLLNIYRGASQVKENVIETVTKTDAQGIPEHFMALVNKILKEGKITGEADRIRSYKHPTRKDIEMDIDQGTGDIDVRFETDQGAKGNYYLKKGQADETTGGRTPPDEFMDGEEVYKFSDDGNVYTKDFEEGISTGTSNLDEFVGIKKKDFASGGIAGMLGE